MEYIKIVNGNLVHNDRAFIMIVRTLDEGDLELHKKLGSVKDYKSVIDAIEPTAEVILNRSYLIRILAAMEYEEFVKISITSEKAPVAICGEEAFGIIMPALTKQGFKKIEI